MLRARRRRCAAPPRSDTVVAIALGPFAQPVRL